MTKKLVNENLKGHQKKINEIIKPQLTILPMNDLAKSLKKFIQEEVHDILININDDICQVQAHLQEIEVDILGPEYLINKLTELEERSCRKNIRIDAIAETPNETLESCKEEFNGVSKNK